MSSASIWTFMSSTAPADAAAQIGGRKASGTGGSVSRIRRWRVQSPPLTTLDGTPGSGVIEPKAPPPPANWNAVT